MKIRNYTDTDWKQVNEIYNLSKRDELKGSVDLSAFIPLERDGRSLRLFRKSCIIVVEEDEAVLGFGGNNGNYIGWLFVHPEHRRRGVGKLILESLLRRLTGTIRLNVFKNNQAARALYEDAGFEIEREFTGNLNGYSTRAMTLRLKMSNRNRLNGTPCRKDYADDLPRKGTGSMTASALQLRAAEPTLEEGRAFARYLDQAAEGFFQLMLGRRSVEIIANAYTQPDNDMSYQYVTFAEVDNRIIGMFSGYTAEQHRCSTDLPLRKAAGGFNLRMVFVSLLFAPMLRILDTIADGDFYLQAIAIDREHRGKGVGSALLDAVEECARAKESKRLSLDVSAGNKTAVALYHQRGMRIESQWPRRLPIPGFKLYRLTKSLDER